MIIDHLFTRPLFESQMDPITQFASNAHEEWRRNFDPTGTKPRIKKNSDGTEGDINVPFADLHPDWQKENLAAGHAAHRAVKHFGRDMEKAAEYVHSEWMKRNPRADYNAAQHVPYDALPEDEKEKDRVHVRTMMRLMGQQPEQGVAEESSKNKYSNLSNRGVNRGINRAGDDFDRMLDLDQAESPHYKLQHQQNIKKRIQTKPMAGPKGVLPEQGVAEVAPPGAKAERMVKHIKQGYAGDGKLTPKEKGIAYATAWKAHNAGRVEEQGVAKGEGGNWYIRVNGKILNDTKYKPEIFSSEDEARSHAMKLADKKRIPLSQIKLTKSWMDAPEQGVAEVTGDKPFDKMMTTIKQGTGKQKTADRKEQQKQTQQRARDAFGNMFGGGNPADKLKIREQGVAKGLEQTPDQVRQTLNAWMEQDQQYEDPTKRAGFQAKVWPYIEQNIKTILADRGEDGKGSYPAAPYAAWLLVQHMDAYPQNQGKFLQQLEQSGLDPTDGKDGEGKLQFLKDRYKVNKWIAANANNEEYFINNEPLPNPTVNVRNPTIFKDAGQVATSRKDALKNAVAAGNKLLVAAVRATDAQTQPSYKSNVAEGSLNEFAQGDGPDRGNYLKELARAWYNMDIEILGDIARKGGSPMDHHINVQETIEKMLDRGIHCPDGKVRKYYIGYNSKFDGVEIASHDHYEHSDYDDAGNEIDDRTGKPWGPYDVVEFSGNELNESVNEADGKHRIDSLVTDALKIMRGPEMSDAVLALKRVLGDRAYNERRGFYSFYVDQIHKMYNQQDMAEGSLNEFAPGSGGGESGRWYTDDEMTDIVGDGWWQDMDVSGTSIGVLDSEVPKEYMIQQAQAWLDDQGYSVQVLNCKVNDDDMEWYIEGSFQNPGFAKKSVAESNTLMKKLHQALLQEGRVKELADDLKTLNDTDFMKKYGKAKAAIRRDMKKVDEGNANSGRRGPNSPPDRSPVKLGAVQKLKTGIKHHADSSRYGGSVPDTEDDHLLSPAARHRLHKAVTPDQQDLDEGNMPQSVVKSKQKYADMSDQEFHAAHKNKSEDDLKSMAWRHGYGKGSNHYVNRHKKGGGQLNELSTNKLAQYKTAAAADAKKADAAGDFKRGDKRLGGIVKATKKQFDNDAKKIDESRRARQALMARIVNSR